MDEVQADTKREPMRIDFEKGDIDTTQIDAYLKELLSVFKEDVIDHLSCDEISPSNYAMFVYFKDGSKMQLKDRVKADKLKENL